MAHNSYCRGLILLMHKNQNKKSQSLYNYLLNSSLICCVGLVNFPFAIPNSPLRTFLLLGLIITSNSWCSLICSVSTIALGITIPKEFPQRFASVLTIMSYTMSN